MEGRFPVVKRQTDEEKVRCSIMLPKTLKKHLVEQSKKQELSMSWLVQKSLEKTLPKPAGRPPKR